MGSMSLPYVILLICEALLGLAMVGLILLHQPKGEGMGGIGSGATMFSGKRGAEAGLDVYKRQVHDREIVVGSIHNL